MSDDTPSRLCPTCVLPGVDTPEECPRCGRYFHLADGPSIPMCFAARKEASIPIGHSKLGGCPDLPKDWSWPANRDKKLLFLWQINLAEIPRQQSKGLLPLKGLLWLFSDLESSGYDPKHRGAWRVLFQNNPRNLERRPAQLICGQPNEDSAYLPPSPRIVKFAYAPRRRVKYNRLSGQLLGGQAFLY